MKQSDFHSQAILQNVFLLENIQGGIVYSDYEPPFHLRYATEGMARLSGYAREELLTMQQMDLVHEDDIPALVEDVTRQFATGDTFEVEYRLKRKDGSYVHVLDRAKAVEHEDGKKYIHCLLTDITELKCMELDLRLSKEKYKIAMQQCGYAILEYDPATTALSASENYTQIFGGLAPCGALADFARSTVVAPAHATIFLQLFDITLRTKCSASMELQVQDKSNQYIWALLQLTPLVNTAGKVYAVLGCLHNIDARKRRLQELTDLAQRDGLTGAYNRTTVESFVNRHLEPPTPKQEAGQGAASRHAANPGSDDARRSGALLIVDIDNFKHINDTFGHDMGDELLISMVERLRSLLQPQDLLGRLGGDEFLIYIPNAKDLDSITALAANIVRSGRHTLHGAEQPVTVSVGVALCGQQCRNFKTLYKNADMALYEVKRRGRNGYHVFQPTAVE